MNNEEVNLKIGEFIRIHRQNINLSIRQLEKQSGVSRSVISQLEGSVEFKSLNPKMKSIQNILNCFNQTFLDLFLYVYDKEIKKD